MPLDDRALLDAWRQGDSKAGSALFDRHFLALRRFFRNKVSSEAEADELLQRTFMGCVEGASSFRGEASFRTWMFGVAHNVLRMWIREKTRSDVELESQSLTDLGFGPSSALDRQWEHRLLLEALRRIPLESQVVLELYFWEEMPAKQLALVFNVPEGTIRGRIRKAKDELEREARLLARAGGRLETTEDALHEWAQRVREAWGVV